MDKKSSFFNRSYAVLSSIQFGKDIPGCGSMRKRTANLRQSSRIAFSLRRRALLRLIACAGIARRLEKCWGKTRPRVFLLGYHSFLF